MGAKNLLPPAIQSALDANKHAKKTAASDKSHASSSEPSGNAANFWKKPPTLIFLLDEVTCSDMAHYNRSRLHSTSFANLRYYL